MSLPPLTRPQDSAFLRKMTEVVVDAFWQNYVNALSAEAQQTFFDACENGTDALCAWRDEYADFIVNREAEDIGREVLEEIAAKLPSILQKEYPLFSEEDALAL